MLSCRAAALLVFALLSVKVLSPQCHLEVEEELKEPFGGKMKHLEKQVQLPKLNLFTLFGLLMLY